MIAGRAPQTSMAGHDLTAEQQHALRVFGDLLMEWNQRINLTGIKDRTAVDQRLIGESLLLLPAINDVVTSSQHTDRLRLIDIGTGAGLPGIPIAIVKPEIEIALLDATGKKITFLQEVVRVLGLRNVTTIHGRAEEIAHQFDHRSMYDIVTARAVATLPVLLELSLPFLVIGGRGIFPKGATIAQELTEASTAAGLLGGAIVSDTFLPDAPELPSTRLILVDKIDATPQRYPRRTGQPAKKRLGRSNPQ